MTKAYEERISDLVCQILDDPLNHQHQWQSTDLYRRLKDTHRIQTDLKKNTLIIHLESSDMTIDQKQAIEQSFWNHPLAKSISQISKDNQLTAKLNFTQSISKRSSQSHKTGPSPFMVSSVAKRPIDQIGVITCVASGKGGVGKSTVAAHLARTLVSQNLRVGLLDADIHGPSAPQLLDLKGRMDVTADHKVIPLQKHGIKCVSFGFISDAEHPALWRGPLISKAVEQFLFDVSWGPLDHLIIDLPPGTGDIPMTLAESIAIDTAVIVSTAHPIAIIDAHKALSMFQSLGITLTGVIGNMVSYQCTHCSHPNHLFGHPDHLIQMCHRRGVSHLGDLPLLTHPPDFDKLHELSQQTTDPHNEYHRVLRDVAIKIRRYEQSTETQAPETTHLLSHV